METVHYLRTLFRQWWLILITLAAGAGGGYIVYNNTVPLYESSITFIVSNSSQDRVLATTRALSVSQIAATQPAVADALLASDFPNATPEVTAAATGSNPFLTITVVATSPAIAESVASAYSESLPATSFRLLGSGAPASQLNGVASPLELSIIAPATLPTQPFTPVPLRDIGLGLMAGLVLGIAIALLRDSFNRTVRESAELAQLTGLTILGTIPRDSAKSVLPVTTDPRGSRAEAYRQVRTSIVNSSTVRPLTIVVTSATSGEGKTTVTANVAAAFSRAGHRVAVVDADLRRPKVAEYFGLENELGLTEVLSGKSTLQDALQIQDEGRLAILTSGSVPANPSEALSGIGMEQVLQQLSGGFEFVFVDTPPVLPVTDALVLAPKVDAVILIVRLGYTTADRVRHAMDAIARVKADIVGVVPNQAGKGSDREYRYKYRYGYSLSQRGEKTPYSIDIEPQVLRTPTSQFPEPIRIQRASRATDLPPARLGSGGRRRARGAPTHRSSD